MKKFSVIIIGAGKIGAFFDTPQSREFLTHAHAFSAHPGFELLGFVDSSLESAERASHIWGGNAYQSVDEAFSHNTVDVAVVATPDDRHLPLLKELAKYSLELVIAEKPLTRTVAEAEEILALYRENGIRISVNYSRRFVPEFSDLASDIASGVYGRYINGSGHYGKGTTHNGTHMIDLLGLLLGEIKVADVLGCIDDYYEDDPSCTACLSLSGGKPFFMQAVSCKLFTIFELDLFFEQKRIKITDSGCKIEYYAVCKSELVAGYSYLGLERTIDTSLNRALQYVADQTYSCLLSGKESVCSGNEALKSLKIAHEVKMLATNSGLVSHQ